jgi:hypothetical protein
MQKRRPHGRLFCILGPCRYHGVRVDGDRGATIRQMAGMKVGQTRLALPGQRMYDATVVDENPYPIRMLQGVGK